MLHVFSKTCIGYTHLDNKKPCQDFSSQYIDNDRTIITCCDGHGGEVYIRSDIGSRLASYAIVNVFCRLKDINYRKYTVKETMDKIRLEVLCEWNKLVERELANRPIKRIETEELDDDKKDLLRISSVKAYGTTLSGAMVLDDKLVVISIGDTEVMGIRNGKIEKLFDYDDDPVANLTYSMCQEDAYDYLRVKIYDFKFYDGVLLCTDGFSSPYQSYDNFNESFVRPLMQKIINHEDLSYVNKFVEDMALNLGIGDDVSLAFIINDKVFKKYYK